MRIIAVTFTAALAACGSISGDGDGDTSVSLFDIHKPCSNSNKCPSGQFCFNGLCAVGCNSNGDCRSDEYCDASWRQCHSKVVSACPATPCAEVQRCVSGVCTAQDQPATTCNPNSLQDGCPDNAFCIQEQQGAQPTCLSMPACGENGACPAGLRGAVCNVDIISQKGRVCLPGMCKAVADCPSAWKCVRANPTDVVGYCGNGGLGSPCSSNADCASTRCMQGRPGTLGMCV